MYEAHDANSFVYFRMSLKFTGHPLLKSRRSYHRYWSPISKWYHSARAVSFLEVQWNIIGNAICCEADWTKLWGRIMEKLWGHVRLMQGISYCEQKQRTKDWSAIRFLHEFIPTNRDVFNNKVCIHFPTRHSFHQI